MKDIDVNEVMEYDALFRGSTTGESLSRIQEMQKVYDKFNNVWIWVDMTVANLNDVPGFLLSFAYFKLLEMLSDANGSQQRLKDIKWRQLPWFEPTPKKAREDMLRFYEWAKKDYPNCVMWYGLTIARSIEEGDTGGGFWAATQIAALVEMLEHANAGEP